MMQRQSLSGFLLGAALAGAGCTAPEQPGLIAITGGLVYPVTSEPIPGGTVLIRDGKIEAVGGDVAVPRGARVVDASGMSVIPGIIETHSHMGFKVLNLPATGTNNNELASPINAHVRALDGLDSNDPAFAIALAGGVTTQNVTTGSRSPNSGQAALVKMRGGTIGDMLFGHAGMKMAIRATTPYPGFPETEDEVFELLRGALEAAQDYLEQLAAHHADPAANPRPPRNLTHEALGKVLTREWVLGIHSHSEAQMRHAMQLKRLFDLDAYIHHGSATNILAEELAELEMPVSYGPILPFDGRENEELEGPVRLAELGGLVAFHQDHPDGHQYFLRHTASMFVRRGMPPEEALKALTWNGARIFHIEDRVGSLEPGKDADVVLLRGDDPLAYEALVERVFVDGVEVLHRAAGYNVFGDRVAEGW